MADHFPSASRSAPCRSAASIRRVAYLSCFQVQEAPEKAFLCPAERGHSGAGCRPAEYRDESDDEKLAEVMARVVRLRIGDVIEGETKDLHGGGLAPGIESAIKNPFRRPPQEPLLRPSEPNVILLPGGKKVELDIASPGIKVGLCRIPSRQSDRRGR